MKTLEERFGIRGHVALVTGAGLGIGRAIAETLAHAGAAVAIQDLQEDAAKEAAKRITSGGGRAITIVGDLTKEAVQDEAVSRTAKELGRLDVLVNNAGIYPFADFLELPAETLDRVLDLNLRAVFRMTQKAGKKMVELGNGGTIVNLASIQGLAPRAPGVSHYNVTKAGVVMLTRSAAIELAAHGIRVNAVAPGVIATPGTSPLIAANALGDPKASVRLGRWGTPEDVADLVLYLVSPAASYVTGETVVIDGGMTLA